jgi:hypothetical protein
MFWFMFPVISEIMIVCINKTNPIDSVLRFIFIIFFAFNNRFIYLSMGIGMDLISYILILLSF